MKEQETSFPPFRETYELSEREQKILDRYKEELQSRLKTKVSFDIYTENYLVHPIPYSKRINIELTAGNWHKVQSISEQEIELGQGEVFYYAMRRMVDDTMSDLLVRGANTF